MTQKVRTAGSSRLFVSRFNISTYLRGIVTHASWSNLGCEKDLSARDARGTHCIRAWLFISVDASRVDVSIAGAEGVESDGFSNICGSTKTESGVHSQVSIRRRRVGFLV